MLQHLRPAVAMIVLFTLLTGIAYPLAVTGLARLAFPFQAGGSLLKAADGRIVGSALLAQGFARPGYLHPRGSAAGAGYDATNSSGSNLGPMDKKLITAVGAAADGLRKENPGGALIPPDAVTQSGSGLDPDVSPGNAALQATRIAKARGVAVGEVQALIVRDTAGPALGFIGQPHVNVLAVNRDLDHRYPIGAPARK